MEHPKIWCSSSAQGGKLLQTPSGQQTLGDRWAVKGIQKSEGKSPTFTIFRDLRRGVEGLQRGWGHLCETSVAQLPC